MTQRAGLLPRGLSGTSGLGASGVSMGSVRLNVARRPREWLPCGHHGLVWQGLNG
jgi:hypothetical protein